MITINESHQNIINAISSFLENEDKDISKIEGIILQYILEALQRKKLIKYIAVEQPENFVKFNRNILSKKFKVPNFDYFIEFNTYFYDYIGEQKHRQNIPSAFLKISKDDDAVKNISKFTNQEIKRDLIIPFFYLQNNWQIPLYALSYDHQKVDLIFLFPTQEQNLYLKEEKNSSIEEKNYYIHYLLETYKKIILVNFNPNIDFIHHHKDGAEYLIPHIYLKKENSISSEDWLVYHKFDEEKIEHLRFFLKYGLKFPS